MSVQASPTPSHEIRRSYSGSGEESEMLQFSFPIRVPNPAEGNDQKQSRATMEPVTATAKKSRWSLSNLLVGYCPEYIVAFAN